MEKDYKIPLILGKPFLATGRALIVVQKGRYTLRVNEQKVMFNIYQATKFLDDANTYHRIDFIDSVVKEVRVFIEDPLEHCMMIGATYDDITTTRDYAGSKGLIDCILALESLPDDDNPSQSEDIQ